MLKAIKDFFDEKIKVHEPEELEHSLSLATAALMVEMMLNDGKTHEAEEQVLKKKLQQLFSLSSTETSDLFDLAHTEVKDAVDYHQFTTLIAKNFSQPQKIKVIEHLWAVAYADNHLDPYEELMVRKISDLIFVSHSDFINAKHRVIKETG
ncbi:MAG: hypothetical protein BMS9Abin31_0725 [Gammaproteobacteria bacterium]|nr:MAG: hypothetical protein BMS9Abin31_0725 [Gammaproteobacteria bacterium]